MLRTWICNGMLLVGLGLSIVGCDDGSHGDGEVTGAADNLKGRGTKPKPDPKGDEDDAPPAQVDASLPSDDLPSSCAALLCPTNTRCVEKAVQCIRAPCPAIATCEPIDVDPVATCAATLCKEGTTCVESPKGAQCVDNPTPTATCAATLCKEGTTCVEGPNGAECVEQKCTAKCSADQHCELKEVVCVRAPCNPVPTCVDNTPDKCATVRCKAGTHCQVTQIQCFTTPCDPIVECVAD